MPVRSAVLSLLRRSVVEVSGPSMVPTLRHGDVLVTRRLDAGTTDAVRPGDVVLAHFRDLPDRLVVKRAVRRVDGGWWLASDNPFAAGDSETHGVADVSARVLWRLRPGWPCRVRRGKERPVPDWVDG